VSALSPKQLDFLQNSTAQVNVCDGSIRGGKTFVTLLRWFIFVARAPRGGELVMIGRTRDSIWRNLVSPMQDPALFGPMASQVIGNVGAPTVKIMGRLVHLIGASDAKAEKVIRGMTVAGAYVDEITVLAEEFFTQLLGRMSVAGAKLFGSTNPDNPAHWFKVKFLDRLAELNRDDDGNPVRRWAHWRFTMDDNPSLTEDYKAAKRKEFTGLWFRRFIQGEWVAAEGAIYSMWDPEKHVVPWAELPRFERFLAVGVDYGTNHPTTALLLGVAPDYDEYGRKTRRRLYLVDEWGTPDGHLLTDAELSRQLRVWLDTKHHPTQHLQPEYLVYDHAGLSFRTQLYKDGVQNLIPADKAVEYGIKTVASLLGNGSLLVSDRCRGFIREITGYSWDDKAKLQGKDQPVKVADDYMDAARYAITTTETLWSELITAA
jgi:PBSX family phage terminase large subunit